MTYLIGFLFCLCVVSGVLAAWLGCRGSSWCQFWAVVFLASSLGIVGLAP